MFQNSAVPIDLTINKLVDTNDQTNDSMFTAMSMHMSDDDGTDSDTAAVNNNDCQE